MKKWIIIAIPSVFALVAFVFLLITTPYKVYFYDSHDGQQYELATIYQIGEKITIKNRWFRDFEQREKSGLLVFVGDDQYTYRAYTFLNVKNDTRYDDYMDEYQELYEEYNTFTFTPQWYEKDSNTSLDIEKTDPLEHERLEVAVGVTSEPYRIYGSGVYIVPSYTSEGALINDSVLMIFGSGTSLNDTSTYDEEQFITQEILYSIFTIDNGEETLELMVPYFMVGGLLLHPTNDAEHFTYSYHNHDVIMEAVNYMIEE
ncbi:hypothetical protein [Candidatus Xianfuyuplasma coldseepsis]|uniref:Uncharacterized protein n=1 Tax=Candidatus Xianfuyuplasma coldseepsis TaxID=2782163 RepID=A0A7L7KU66_9MOLU|nr:hypothetical protein [Xianfuyuplasma coldseepsis]QMS85318.1 hypothetical protein G4Z02_05980 [Xianfuyuplasma coldseepsis]